MKFLRDNITEFMKDNEMEEMMEIAFMTESSIQDELDRSSSGDFLTIGISYLIMFLYISLALGNTSSFSTCLVSTARLYRLKKSVTVNIDNHGLKINL